MTFKSFDEYIEWTEKFDNCSEYENIPVAIITDNKIAFDMFTECKSGKTAIRRFEKAFNNLYNFMPDWACTMRESFENGYDHDATQADEYGNYSWGVEEVNDGCWYVYLNLSGSWI